MILRVTKTFSGVLDTELERNRIRKAFKDDAETRKHLMALMDVIECWDWKKAAKLLSSKWWRGRDRKMECPRVEFIGLLDLRNESQTTHPAVGFDCMASYMNLVEGMIDRPNNYKVEKV